MADAYRAAVPAHYRLFVSSMLGDRSPITEHNFSPVELQTLHQYIAKDQAYLPTRAADQQRMVPIWEQAAREKQQRAEAVKKIGHNLTEDEAWKYGVGYTPGQTTNVSEAVAQLSDSAKHFRELHDQAANVARRASHGVGAITYSAPDQMSMDVGTGYNFAAGRERGLWETPQKRIGPFAMGLDYGDRNTNALANTLGEFVYKPAPGGGTQIDDNYNWNHLREVDPGGKPWGVSDALALAVKTGNVEPLISNLMPDAAHGRPIHIALPPPPRGMMGASARQ